MAAVNTETAMVLVQLRLGPKTIRQLWDACKAYGLFIRMPLLRTILTQQLNGGGIVLSGGAQAFGSIGYHRTKAQRALGDRSYTLTYIGNLTLDAWVAGERLSA